MGIAGWLTRRRSADSLRRLARVFPWAPTLPLCEPLLRRSGGTDGPTATQLACQSAGCWPGQQVRVTSHFSFVIFHTFCFWIMTKAYLPHSSLSILAFMTDSRNSEMKLFKYSYSICKNTLLMIFVINGVFRCYIWYIYYSIYVYMCAFVHFVKKFWKVIFHIFHRIVYYGRKLYFCTYWVFHNILEYYSEWSYFIWKTVMRKLN